MGFNIFSNMLMFASRRVAGWVLSIGLVLTGFGILIIAYPRFFAAIAAIIFFVTGGGFILTAAKIYLTAARLKKNMDSYTEPPAADRENVRLHFGHGSELSDYDDSEYREQDRLS